MVLAARRLSVPGPRLLIGIVLWLASANWPAIAASFDCNSPRLTSVETTICADTGLSALDLKLASIYAARARQASPADKSRLVREEKVWLSERNNCSTSECLRQAYDSRIASLSDESQLAPSPIPSPTSPTFAASPASSVSGTEVVPTAVKRPASAATAVPSVSATEVLSNFPSSILIWLAVVAAFIFVMIKSPAFRRGFVNALFRRTSGPHSSGPHGLASSDDRVRGYCVYEVNQIGLSCKFPVPETLATAIQSARNHKSRDPRANFVVCEVRSDTSKPGATAFSI
jgi:uncharacterized protein